MASSSKNISMPLVFAISIGSVFAMVASTVFAMAWYAYEDNKAVSANVKAAPMHSAEYEAKYGEGEDAEQNANIHRHARIDSQPVGGMPETRYLFPIEAAMDRVVRENGGHIEHSHEDDDDHGHDHDGHDHD